MKKLLIPLLGILALAGTACEQHSAAELHKALGKHAEHEAAAPEAAPATPAPAVEAETAKPAGEPAADAPKFFQKK